MKAKKQINLRIIGGSLKGRYISVASLDNELKPTKEAVREAIFSALNSRIDFSGCTILDLYSGSGALSFEAISRGAKKVTSVESSKRNCASISENVKNFGIKDQCRIVNSDVYRFLDTEKESYDVCFSDPPYESINFSEFLSKILNNKILKPAGILVMEDEKKYLNTWVNSLSTDNRGYEILFLRDYGITSVIFLKLIREI